MNEKMVGEEKVANDVEPTAGLAAKATGESPAGNKEQGEGSVDLLFQKAKSFKRANSEEAKKIFDDLALESRSKSEPHKYLLSVQKDEYERYKILAQKLDMTFNAFCCEALRHYFYTRLTHLEKLKKKEGDKGPGSVAEEDDS